MSVRHLSVLVWTAAWCSLSAAAGDIHVGNVTISAEDGRLVCRFAGRDIFFIAPWQGRRAGECRILKVLP